jgi:hypothetical protein
MKKGLTFFAIIVLIIFPISQAFSQEMSLATFQETAQVIVDKSMSQNVTAAITLQSTSIQEIQIPAELEKKIRENDRIISITVTNQNQCVLGVIDQSCIMINVLRDESDKGIAAIQNSTKDISLQLIDDLNQVLDTNAKFHSVFIHTDDQARKELGTSGVISGRGVISAVYTMPMEDTSSMYEKMSAILIPKTIRESGGFYDVAKNLSSHENSKMTFSIIPTEKTSLLQLRLSVDYPQLASSVNKINPLEFFKTDELKRSEYFSGGFYPLNSILQVVVLSPMETSISEVKGNIIPTQMVDGEKIPTDITKSGWVFDPEQGMRIQGKYIFGDKDSVNSNDVMFALDGSNLDNQDTTKETFDESIAVVIIIAIVAIAAAMFYLKGYKK